MTAIKMPDPASKVIEPPPGGMVPMAGPMALGFVLNVATTADGITAWGMNPRERDMQLRAFWPTEAYFASALFTTVAQYAAFDWSLSGPPRTTKIAQEILNRVQFGQGWEAFITPVLVDYFTTDNGAFIEVVRAGDEYNSPVVSLNHLDSRRCIRTGQTEEPVIYLDIKGNYHKLKWWQVITLTEMPSPIEEARGLQYCALTRVLRSAQIMRDISIVKQEKAAGRFTRQIHLVSGISTSMIQNAMEQKQQDASNMGMLRYITPLVIGSIDPTATVKTETINLASIPDDYDERDAFQTYITLIAMALGGDYQNFAPLPGGGLGSGSQSKVMNMKSRGKGAALFMRKIERLFNFHGIMLGSVKFVFGEQDTAQQMEETELRKARALEREIRIRSGEITTEVARQMAVDLGDLDERYLVMMREQNATDEITIDSTTPYEPVNDGDIKPGTPGPKEPPKAAGQSNNAVPRPGNSNAERSRNPATNQRRSPGGTPEAGAAA